jgi:predicted Rdx family selenoprotein
VGLAASLIDRWAPILSSVELVTSKGGVFTVTLDGEVVFDKKAEGRHAAPGEVESRVEKALGPRLNWK